MIHAKEYLNEKKGKILVIHEYEVLIHEMVNSILERWTDCFIQRVAYHFIVQCNPDCRLLRQIEIFFGRRECSQQTVAYMQFFVNHFLFFYGNTQKKTWHNPQGLE
jgi:hypothetical protein